MIRRFGLGGVALHRIGSADLEMREMPWVGLPQFQDFRILELVLLLGCLYCVPQPWAESLLRQFSASSNHKS